MTERSRETMKDVSHTAPHGGDVSAVWHRGRDPEPADETAADETAATADD